MTEDLALQLERDKQRLADWRSSPLKKRSIPQDIWDSILSYYPTLSVARICREFRITYQMLRPRIGLPQPQPRLTRSSQDQAFVDLASMVADSSPSLRLDVNGISLRFRGAMPDPAYLASLVSHFKEL